MNSYIRRLLHGSAIVLSPGLDAMANAAPQTKTSFSPITTASSGLWDSLCMRQYLLLMLLVPWGICDGGHGSVVESICSLFSFPHWRNQVNCTANPLDSVPLLQSVCLYSRKKVLLNLKSYGYLCYFCLMIYFGYSHWISIVISSTSIIS